MIGGRDKTRREFIKTSIAYAAGVAGVGHFADNPYASEKSIWTDRMPINPMIDNLRVVYCTDASMVKTTPVRWDYDSQNRNIDTDRVSDNLDRMAVVLSRKSTPSEAWTTIFRKPATKPWADVKVAIKVNTQCWACMPRYAVVVKVCEALIDYCGVRPGNICIYSCEGISHAANLTRVEACYGLPANLESYPFPDGVKTQSNLFSGLHTATVACPGGAKNPVGCLNDLADGTVDILVNIAVNKGHYQAGDVTLCQKNYIGSLKFFCPGNRNSRCFPFFPLEYPRAAPGDRFHSV